MPEQLSLLSEAVPASDTGQVTSPQNGNNPQWGDPCHCLASAGHVPTVCITPWDTQSRRVYSVDGPAPTLDARKDAPVVCMGEIVSFPWNAGGNAAGSAIEDGTSPTIRSTRSGEPAVAIKDDECAFIVRKLMPIECERLQGFPDGWTDIEFKGKPASDTARYKALGNSMAVPEMAWIGERIERMNHE